MCVSSDRLLLLFVFVGWRGFPGLVAFFPRFQRRELEIKAGNKYSTGSLLRMQPTKSCFSNGFSSRFVQLVQEIKEQAVATFLHKKPLEVKTVLFQAMFGQINKDLLPHEGPPWQKISPFAVYSLMKGLLGSNNSPLH